MQIRSTTHPVYANSRPIMAAGEDEDLEAFGDLDEPGFDGGFDDPEDVEDIDNTLDDIAEGVEDMQDVIEDVPEDEITIESDNNIDNHFIAECEECQGVFISAVLVSDQKIEKVSGVCPLCGKETDQYLKWYIKSAEELEEELPE